VALCEGAPDCQIITALSGSFSGFNAMWLRLVDVDYTGTRGSIRVVLALINFSFVLMVLRLVSPIYITGQYPGRIMHL
jgi:hypothetical protein